MSSRSSDDASPALPSDPDAHGRAALLLVESLIHGLIARSVLTVAEAVDIMEVALDTQIAIAEDATPPTASMARATTLLSTLAESLRIDQRVAEAKRPIPPERP